MYDFAQLRLADSHRLYLCRDLRKWNERWIFADWHLSVLRRGSPN